MDLKLKARDLFVAPANREDVREFIETHHYSKSINGVKCSVCFKVVHGDELVGALLFGQMSTTAWKKFGETELEVLELRRLVLSDNCGRNSESFVIAKALKHIKKNMVHVKTIVSYADPTYGHTGIIYKASIFDFVGITPTDKGYVDEETGKMYHSRALRTKYKGEYKPFVKRLRKKLEEGLLKEVVLEGKYTYVYKLR